MSESNENNSVIQNNNNSESNTTNNQQQQPKQNRRTFDNQDNKRGEYVKKGYNDRGPRRDFDNRKDNNYDRRDNDKNFPKRENRRDNTDSRRDYDRRDNTDSRRDYDRRDNTDSRKDYDRRDYDRRDYDRKDYDRRDYDRRDYDRRDYNDFRGNSRSNNQYQRRDYHGRDNFYNRPSRDSSRDNGAWVRNVDRPDSRERFPSPHSSDLPENSRSENPRSENSSRSHSPAQGNDQPNDSAPERNHRGNNNEPQKYVPPHLRGQKRGNNSFEERPKSSWHSFNSRSTPNNWRDSSRNEQSPFTAEPASSNQKIDFDKYDEIPIEVSGKDCPKPLVNSFLEVDLGEGLINNINAAHYERPTPVQRYSIPIVLSGRDLMACAQTGSGKTASFLFPMISHLLSAGPPEIPSNESQYGYRRRVYPSALILAPTRELACQIHDEARKFSWKTGIKSAVVFGGSPIQQQLRELDYGCDILVATPGRLVDIMERSRLSLSQVRFLVLDEADRMLDMGFEPQIRNIVEKQDLPLTGTRHTLMFSATFPKQIQLLASEFLTDYIFLAVGRVGSATELVTQKFIRVEEADKPQVLLDLCNSVKGLTIIFVETRKKADYLERFLLNNNFPASSIHGDRQQSDRLIALRLFSSGKTPFLIATNVAARGLDIDNIAHVINFDMPTDIDDYVHRIGRTGRAGKAGLATALIGEENQGVVSKLLEILHEAEQEIPPWLEHMGRRNKPHGFKKSQNQGSNRFASRDYRDKKNFSSNSFSSKSDNWSRNTSGGSFAPSFPSFHGGGF